MIYSPAHHQIHHSTNPDHFGKNLGAFLTLWDWAVRHPAHAGPEA